MKMIITMKKLSQLIKKEFYFKINKIIIRLLLQKDKLKKELKQEIEIKQIN